jgi:hypothetical protein
MFRRRMIAAIVVAPTLAAKGGGGPKSADPPCTISGNTVSASGLPTGEVINFMVSDASGTTGWVLGFTPDGTWSVNVPSPKGTATYQFISRTWGPSGSKYTVFSSCST